MLALLALTVAPSSSQHTQAVCTSPVVQGLGAQLNPVCPVASLLMVGVQHPKDDRPMQAVSILLSGRGAPEPALPSSSLWEGDCFKGVKHSWDKLSPPRNKTPKLQVNPCPAELPPHHTPRDNKAQTHLTRDQAECKAKTLWASGDAWKQECCTSVLAKGQHWEEERISRVPF